MKQRYAAIMAGGSGERFWPLSRHLNPKQLLKLPGSGLSMLGATLARLGGLVETENVLVLTAPHLTEAVGRDCPSVPARNILAEPMKRNTAGCLCWLAANLLAQGVEPAETSIAVLPADHRIGPVDAFQTSVEAAFWVAEQEGALVTIGIRPTRPEIGYGYIESDSASTDQTENGCRWSRVVQFHEKPSLDLATTYLKSEAFHWNSGMFFWRLDAFLSELERSAPRHHRVLSRLVPLIRNGDALAAESVFAELPDISIDYALMEHASNVATVEANFEWDDVGSWDALARYLPSDVRGNTTLGDSVLVKAADCVVHNSSKDLTVCLAGVYDLLVVVTDDAVLICDKSEVQSVRDVVAQLRTAGSTKL